MPSVPDISLTLPLPPSANRMWSVARGIIFKSRDYKAWATEVRWLCAHQGAGDRVPGRYMLRLVAPKSRLDLDNIVKPTCDALQLARVVTNDRHARRIVLEVDEEREAGTMLVELWALPDPIPVARKRAFRLA